MGCRGGTAAALDCAANNHTVTHNACHSNPAYPRIFLLFTVQHLFLSLGTFSSLLVHGVLPSVATSSFYWQVEATMPGLTHVSKELPLWGLQGTSVPASSTLNLCEGRCSICLADGCKDLVNLGCGCRGENGKAHFDCMYQLCKAKQETAGGGAFWSGCGLCSVSYSNALQDHLLFKRCRQNEALEPGSAEALELADLLANCFARRGNVTAATNIYEEILPL